MSALAFADCAMCILWSISYLLLFTSTIREKRPSLSPLGSAVILPWEAIAFARNFPPTDYVGLNQLAWFILHSGIFILALKKAKKEKKCFSFYLDIAVFISVFILLKFIIFPQKNGQLYTSYANTIVFFLFIIIYSLKPYYPINRSTLAFAFIAFVADLIAIPVYITKDKVTAFLCITLQILHLIHIIAALYSFKKSGIKFFESPEKCRSYLINEINIINNHLKSKLLPQKNYQKRRTYKKKTKNKKTHRKK